MISGFLTTYRAQLEHGTILKGFHNYSDFYEMHVSHLPNMAYISLTRPPTLIIKRETSEQMSPMKPTHVKNSSKHQI